MPDSTLPSKCGPFALVAAFLLASFALSVSAEEYRSPSDGIHSMTYEEGRLSLDARNAPLDKILSELSRMARITIIADGPIEGRVSLYTDRVPLEKALRKLLRGKDTTFVYTAKDETSPTEYEVMEVRIYLTNGEKGEARTYSYSRNGGQSERSPSPSRSRSERFPSGEPLRRRPGASPPVPPMATNEEAQRLISGLMEGNLDGLDQIAEKLKAQNPDVEEQIEEFLKSLEDARVRAAEESGSPIPPLEGLGDMQNLMQQMLNRGRMPPGGETE